MLKHHRKDKRHSEETRRKMSETLKGKKSHLYGKHLSEEHKKKISDANKGKKRSEEQKKQISDVHKGKKLSEDTRRKMSKARKGEKNHFYGKHHSEEAKKKMGEANKIARKGKNHSEETKEKMRLSAFEYVKRVRDILYPRIGHNEKRILDELEQELNYKILRQYKVAGYFLDGYIPELNLAIEVDERPKDKLKDIERQQIIENKLKCKFVRINDYD